MIIMNDVLYSLIKPSIPIDNKLSLISALLWSTKTNQAREIAKLPDRIAASNKQDAIDRYLGKVIHFIDDPSQHLLVYRVYYDGIGSNIKLLTYYYSAKIIADATVNVFDGVNMFFEVDTDLDINTIFNNSGNCSKIYKRLSNMRMLIGNDVYPYSRLADNSFFTADDGTVDISKLNQFMGYYWTDNINSMKQVFNHEYIDFGINQERFTAYRDAGFWNRPYSVEDLAKDILQNGSYTPIYGFKHLTEQEMKSPSLKDTLEGFVDDGYNIIINRGGLHRYEAIQHLVTEGVWNNQKILCLFKDDPCDVDFNKVGLILHAQLLEYIDASIINRADRINKDYMRLYAKTLQGFKVLMQEQNKELRAIIDIYESVMLINEIRPPECITKRGDV